MYKIGEEYNNFIIIGEDINNKNKLLCKCKKCGYITSKYKTNISRKGCGVCSKQVIIRGVNDALTTNQELRKYVVDENEFIGYGAFSRHKVHARCPDCGEIKIISIASLSYGKFSCNKCSDKRSYPNKFMYNLLCQLDIEFEAEKTFTWSNRKIYDFYLPKYNIIIEMNGRQHYKEGFATFAGANTLSKQKEIDIEKNILANNNGIEKYFTINASKSEKNFLKKSIIECGLLNVLQADLTSIDWEKCDKFSNKNIIKEICIYYKNNPNLSSEQIGNMYHLSKQTIISYLKKGTALSWCNYNPLEKMQKNGIKNSPFKNKEIVCMEYPDIIFKNAKEASNFIKEKDGIELLVNSIRRVASGERKSYKRYHFNYK